MFSEVRPFDWLMLIIEVLVLLLILYEVIANAVHAYKGRKRELALSLIVTSLTEFMEKGRNLQLGTPDPSMSSPDEVSTWIDSVKLWAKDTNDFITRHSLRATVSFALIEGTGVMANPQVVYTESGYSFPIEGPQRESYQRLVVQLNNLRSIIEKPEAYF